MKLVVVMPTAVIDSIFITVKVFIFRKYPQNRWLSRSLSRKKYPTTLAVLTTKLDYAKTFKPSVFVIFNLDCNRVYWILLAFPIFVKAYLEIFIFCDSYYRCPYGFVIKKNDFSRQNPCNARLSCHCHSQLRDRRQESPQYNPRLQSFVAWVKTGIFSSSGDRTEPWFRRSIKISTGD